MPIISYRPVSRVNSESTWLLSSMRNVTSQIGQDGIIEKIFSIIGATNKFCIEFGAWDGKFLSNTWNLIENLDWSGVLIEANREKFAEISANYTSSKMIALNEHVETTGNNSLDHIMDRVGELRPDFISIDIDGNDWHVWNSLEIMKPRVLLFEFNPTAPNDVYFVQDNNFDINQGSSLLAFIELGKSKGYSLICANQWDAFFVQDELYPLFNINDNSIDAMFFPGWQTKLFQCFDGKLYVAGTKMLIWNGITFAEDQLQILTPNDRGFQDHPSRGPDAIVPHTTDKSCCLPIANRFPPSSLPAPIEGDGPSTCRDGLDAPAPRTRPLDRVGLDHPSEAQPEHPRPLSTAPELD